MNPNIIVLGTLALVLVFVGVYSVVQPALTRRDLLFGVTVPPDSRSSPMGKSIIRRYQVATVGLVLLGLAALAALWRLLSTKTALIAMPFVAIGLLLLCGLPYVWAYYAARRLARSQGGGAPLPAPEPPSAELRPRRYGDYVPWIWELLPLAIIAGTVAFLAATYPYVPDRFPIHFDASGNVNGEATKSVASYFSLVWTQLSMEALITLLSALIVRSRALPGPAEFRFRRAWLRFLFVLKVAVLALFGVISVGIAYSAINRVALPLAFILIPVVFLVAVLLGSLALALRTGQGGARFSPDAPATDRTSDRYWILGSIYINRDDPSLFVERRFGVGWTLNFGNPRSWLVLLAILGISGGASLAAILTTR